MSVPNWAFDCTPESTTPHYGFFIYNITFMPHKDRRPPEDSDIDLPVGDAVEEVWHDGEEWYGSDAHGEFQMERGNKEPVEEHGKHGYRPCNCVVKYTFDRYDERRFCAAPAGDKPTCRNHRNRASDGFVNHGKRRLKNAAEIKSHKTLFRYMEPYEKVVANDIYQSLVDMSTFDFDLQTHQLRVSTEDSDVFEDDVIYLNHPVPNENRIRCKALWYAALDFLTMEMMRRERFRTAFKQSRDDAVEADNITVGERWTVVASGEQGAVYDRDEHHLNLPLSRMQSDYSEELTFGGIPIDGETEQDAGEEREWNLTIIDESEEDNAGYKMDELHPDDPSPLEDIEPE